MQTNMTDLGHEQIDTTNVEAAMQLGVAASEAGDQAKAYDIFSQVAAHFPDMREVWVWLGWTSPTLDESETAFRRANLIDPTNEEAQLGLRWVTSQRETAGQTDMPVAYPDSSSNPGASSLDSMEAKVDLDATLERGMASAQEGDKAAAYNAFGQAVADHPDSAEAWVWLGGVSSSLDEAEMAFRRACELQSDNEEAQLGLRWVTLRRASQPESVGAPATIAAGAAPAEGKSEMASKLSSFAKFIRRQND